MNSHFSVIEACRFDAGASARPDPAGSAVWLAFGIVVERALSLRSRGRARYLAEAAKEIVRLAPDGAGRASLERMAGDPRGESIAGAIIAVAAEAESAGSLAVAACILGSGRALVGPLEPLEHGRLAAQEARVWRKFGESDRALASYELVASLASTHDLTELEARALLGRATIAQVHGNYPQARIAYHAVLVLAGALEPRSVARELEGHACHGLMVSASVAGDFDTALEFGWRAVQVARDEEHRLELLTNIASACLLSGQFRAALNAYLTVLTKSTVQRVRLGAMGGAVLAAARSGAVDAVRRLTAVAIHAIRAEDHAYEAADLLRELSDASTILQHHEAAAEYRAQAIERARKHGFYEILHKLDVAEAVTQNAPPTARHLRPPARRVTDSLAAQNSELLLDAAAQLSGTA